MENHASPNSGAEEQVTVKTGDSENGVNETTLVDTSTTTHQPVPEEDCIFCCEEITASNFAEYRSSSEDVWHPSPYCQDCVQSAFIDSQWTKYVGHVEAADCAAALRRALSTAPPLNVIDIGFKTDLSKIGEVYQFFFRHDEGNEIKGKVVSARLKGALTGQERENWWNDKKAFLIASEAEEALVAAASPPVIAQTDPPL